MVTAAVIILVVAICAFALVALYASAPSGWEDEDGFHYGERDEP